MSYVRSRSGPHDQKEPAPNRLLLARDLLCLRSAEMKADSAALHLSGNRLPISRSVPKLSLVKSRAPRRVALVIQGINKTTFIEVFEKSAFDHRIEPEISRLVFWSR
jgi:hypothetical protein